MGSRSLILRRRVGSISAMCAAQSGAFLARCCAPIIVILRNAPYLLLALNVPTSVAVVLASYGNENPVSRVRVPYTLVELTRTVSRVEVEWKTRLHYGHASVKSKLKLNQSQHFG